MIHERAYDSGLRYHHGVVKLALTRKKIWSTVSLGVAVTVVVVPVVSGTRLMVGPPTGPSMPLPAYQSSKFKDHS